MNQITVEVAKLPATRKNVVCYAGDAIERILTEAFGRDDYSKYTIVLNGAAATLATRVEVDGSEITIAAMTKGN